MLSNFRRWMNATVLLAPKTGLDRNAEPSFGSDVSCKGYIEMGNRAIRNDQGTEVISTLRVYLDGDAISSVSVLDRITIPSEYGETQPKILAVNPVKDHTGRLNHWEIFC